MKKFDFVILGQGSAAFAAAIKADGLGIKTAMVGGNATEGAVIGGTCVNVGCLPSKNLITVANAFYGAANSPFEGVNYSNGRLDFRKAIRQKDRLVRKFRKEKYADVIGRLRNAEYFPSRGKFVSKNEVDAGGETLRGDKFLIAVGARSKIPQIPGLEGIDYLDNESALSLKELPESMCVVGGRALGLEFAQMYAHFGTRVTVLQRSERILPEGEPEISDLLKKYLEEEGIRVITGTGINRIKKKGGYKVLDVSASGKAFDVTCEKVLFATGRAPNTEHLGLEKAGIRTDGNGFVAVDTGMQTSAPNCWAAGDAVGEPMLEPLAAKEGAVAVENAFTKNKRRINFKEVPSAVFTSPEVASVGLTDAEAVGKGIKCRCSVLPMDFVSKAHVIGDTRGVVKVVAEVGTKRILGVHILALNAADMIHEGTLAVKLGLRIDDIIDTVHVYPTLSEAIKLATQYFYKDVGKLSCCTE